LIALTAMVVLGVVTEAGAAASCADVRVDMQYDLGDEWVAAVGELHHELARLAQNDCERVKLSIHRQHGVVRIAAVGADGRRAERTVGQPSALVPTALGLILSIPSELAGDTHIPPADPLRPSPLPDRAPDPAVVRQPLSAISPRPFSAWLGIELGGRLGQPTSVVMADLEGRADLLVNHWLLLAWFRYAPVGIIQGMRVDADAYHEIAVGLGVGRSVDVGRVSFDFALTPTLVAAKMEGDGGPAEKDTDDVRQSDVQLRIGASVRLMLPIEKSWRLTFTTDGEVAPTDVSGPVRLDPRLPPFPSWTAGLRVGAIGSLL
jgi:hypothetical protein